MIELVWKGRLTAVVQWASAWNFFFYGITWGQKGFGLIVRYSKEK